MNRLFTEKAQRPVTCTSSSTMKSEDIFTIILLVITSELSRNYEIANS